MASNKRLILDIDLNIEATEGEVSYPSFEIQRTQQITVPDLNDVREGDLNVIPNHSGMSSRILIDLNMEPDGNPISGEDIEVNNAANLNMEPDGNPNSGEDIQVNNAVNLNMEPDANPTSGEDIGVNNAANLNMEPDDDTISDEDIEVNNNENTDAAQANIEVGEQQPQTKKLKTLTDEERRAIFHILQQQSDNGKLKKGVKQFVALSFSVCEKTIHRIWKRGKEDDGEVSQRKINCGRKRVQIDWAQFREIPVSRQTTMRSLAHALNANTTSVFRLLKSGDIRRHSSAIKPTLKEENKKSRLRFCFSMLEDSSIPHDPIFKSMHNIVFIDEKWFYMTKRSKNFYLLPDENDPHRSCQNKNFIGKVMFLVAITRPRFDQEGNEVFSGKIGVFPFVTQEPAKRTSTNRVAGTLETKAMTSINREIMRSFLIEKVLPAIQEKWPREELGCPIFIQHDNARPHIAENDPEFHQAIMQNEFDIHLVCQPANSPDLNVLDLGFFNAIQSLQHMEAPRTIDQLIAAVEKSFEDFSTEKSNRIFLTLQSCMIEIMKNKGSNEYKIPHMKKGSLGRVGNLTTQLKCPPKLVQDVLDYLNGSSN